MVLWMGIKGRLDEGTAQESGTSVISEGFVAANDNPQTMVRFSDRTGPSNTGRPDTDNHLDRKPPAPCKFSCRTMNETDTNAEFAFSSLRPACLHSQFRGQRIRFINPRCVEPHPLPPFGSCFLYREFRFGRLLEQRIRRSTALPIHFYLHYCPPRKDRIWSRSLRQTSSMKFAAPPGSRNRDSFSRFYTTWCGGFRTMPLRATGLAMAGVSEKASAALFWGERGLGPSTATNLDIIARSPKTNRKM
ncbi:hypothetical protein MIND_00513000 [Mycena indigotica]|uniref:Uncharacterized protein n=1 Tax=Mycena indigotica TaxID=2126181 RepID=A0A8H6WCB9_9AGAR|nr:uncharacterized protein MIND_00513000 [Mycena indigotica]KAF7307194.1 hypothetical protein MIND_00513000 [Mycena indigotica]